MIVAVDFDGTLVDNQYPEIGEEAPGAFAWLKKFQAAGVCLILLTMRGGKGSPEGDYLTPAIRFCRKRGIVFWAVNENPSQKWTTSKKIYAHWYVDDHAVGCPLISVPGFRRKVVDWEKVGPVIMEDLEAGW